jgi:hypothetical protein
MQCFEYHGLISGLVVQIIYSLNILSSISQILEYLKVFSLSHQIQDNEVCVFRYIVA